MKGTIKKFDKKLFDKYDTPAREIIKNKIGIEIIDNPDIYGADMIIQIPKCKYEYLELQVCATWTEDRYPHVNPYVYERKGHFSEKTLYLIFNKAMTRALLFDKKSLMPNPRRVQKYSRSYVYDVYWHRVFPVEIEDFDSAILLSYY